MTQRGSGFACRLVLRDVDLEARAQLLLRLRARQGVAINDSQAVVADVARDVVHGLAVVRFPFNLHAPDWVAQIDEPLEGA